MRHSEQLDKMSFLMQVNENGKQKGFDVGPGRKWRVNTMRKLFLVLGLLASTTFAHADGVCNPPGAGYNACTRCCKDSNKVPARLADRCVANCAQKVADSPLNQKLRELKAKAGGSSARAK